jgi:hypothetical protein
MFKPLDNIAYTNLITGELILTVPPGTEANSLVQVSVTGSASVTRNPSVRSLLILDTTTHAITLDAPSVVTAYTLTFPAAVNSTAQSVLVATDASGTLGWLPDPYGNIAIGSSGSFTGPGNATHNILVGSSAGTAITTGDDNICIGRNAGATITTTTGNVCIGPSSAATAGNTIAIGNAAQAVADDCISIGTSTGAAGGAGNVCIGSSAGAALQAGGTYNVFVGHGAGAGVTTGDKNVFIGPYSGQSLGAVTGRFMVANGATADDSLISGTWNIAPVHHSVTIHGDLTVTGTFVSSGGDMGATEVSVSTVLDEYYATVVCTGLGANITITLPPLNSSLHYGRHYMIVNADATWSVTISTDSVADTFSDGVSTSLTMVAGAPYPHLSLVGGTQNCRQWFSV